MVVLKKILLNWFKSVFLRKISEYSDVIVKAEGDSENPVVYIKIGWHRVRLSTTQARRLWGKLGYTLETITQDK